MADVTFHAFPTLTSNRTLRAKWIAAVRRTDSWRPNTYSSVCSLHFVDGMGPRHEFDVPTLFPYNAYGMDTTPKRSLPSRQTLPAAAPVISGAMHCLADELSDLRANEVVIDVNDTKPERRKTKRGEF